MSPFIVILLNHLNDWALKHLFIYYIRCISDYVKVIQALYSKVQEGMLIVCDSQVHINDRYNHTLCKSIGDWSGKVSQRTPQIGFMIMGSKIVQFLIQISSLLHLCLISLFRTWMVQRSEVFLHVNFCNFFSFVVQ